MKNYGTYEERMYILQAQSFNILSLSLYSGRLSHIVIYVYYTRVFFFLNAL